MQRVSGFRSTPAVSVNDGTGCAQDESVNNRRPCVSNRGRTRVEQSVAGRYSVIFAVDYQKETENGTVHCAPIPTSNRIIASPPFMSRIIFLYRDLEVLRNHMSR
jgi:hypothetical protein